MPRLLRLLVAFFLVLAVPLQGLAGVTMASCSGTHAVAGDGAALHGHGAMGHGESHGHYEAMHHAGHDMGHASPGESADGHSCAACAACCSLSVVPAAALATLTAERPSSHPIPFFGSAHASVQARGLERPPSISFPG